MALTITLLDSEVFSDNTTTIVSSSVSPTANALLIAVVNFHDSAGNDPSGVDDTFTGTGDWTQRAYGKYDNYDAGDNDMGCAIYTAQAGATPGSGAVTATFSAACARKTLYIYEVTGHNATTPTGVSGSNYNKLSTITVTLSGTPTSTSLVIAGVASATASDLTIEPGSGYTEGAEVGITGSGGIDTETMYDIGSADDSADWSGLDTVANAGAAVEIKIAAGGNTATLSVTQASQTISASITTETHGTLTQTQASDSLTASITTESHATLEQTQAGDSLVASVITEAKASLDATQAEQTVSASATVTNGPAASLTATQANNTLSASVATESHATLNTAQAGNTLTAAISTEAKASLTATQAGQTLSANVTEAVVSTASLNITQAGDTVSASVTTTASAVLNVTQNGNTSSSTAYAYTITYARPNADTSAGDWTDQDGGTSNLYATIDETTAEDSDYIRSPETPSEDPVVFALSFISTPTYRLSHTVRYRYGKMPDGATDTLNFTVQLREGYTNEANPGTLIAEWTHSNVSTTLATAEQALTSTQAESISDYSDLFVRMVATTA